MSNNGDDLLSTPIFMEKFESSIVKFRYEVQLPAKSAYGGRDLYVHIDGGTTKPLTFCYNDTYITGKLIVSQQQDDAEPRKVGIVLAINSTLANTFLYRYSVEAQNPVCYETVSLGTSDVTKSDSSIGCRCVFDDVVKFNGRQQPAPLILGIRAPSVRAVPNERNTLGGEPKLIKLRLILTIVIEWDAFKSSQILASEIKSHSISPGYFACQMFSDLENGKSQDCDTILKSIQDQTEYPCHRAILCRRSEFFQGSERSESTTKKELNWPADLIREMIHFIYLDTITERFCKLELHQISNAAKMCFLKKLELICERKYLDDLSEENALELLKLGQLFEMKFLKNRAMVLFSQRDDFVEAIDCIEDEDLKREIQNFLKGTIFGPLMSEHSIINKR